LLIAYDSGNLAGVTHALISSVESSIQVARWNSKLHTSQDVFTKMAEQVADVIVSCMALTLFPPDPSDMSSPGFARKRIEAAKSKYAEVLKKLHTVYRNYDPDSPLRDESHGFRRRVDGLSPFEGRNST